MSKVRVRIVSWCIFFLLVELVVEGYCVVLVDVVGGVGVVFFVIVIR